LERSTNATIKKLQPIVAAINGKEAETQAMSRRCAKAQFLKLKDEVQERLKDADSSATGYRDILQAAFEPAIRAGVRP